MSGTMSGLGHSRTGKPRYAAAPITSGTGTYTPQAGTTWLRVRKWGGGGGSGGASSTSGTYGTSSNGSEGQYTDEWIAHTPGATYAYAVGAAGLAGNSGSGTGGTGGTTTFAGTTAAAGGVGGSFSIGTDVFAGPFAPTRSGPGAGGVGVYAYNGTTQAGIAGQAGLILVEEF